MAKQDFVFFFRSASPFSQWHPAIFHAKSVVDEKKPIREFVCAEQYMMAEKALLMGDTEAYNQIMIELNPKKQKALGRKVKNWDEKKWKSRREEIVLAASLAKFSQNEKLKQILLSTGTKELVEASPYDKIWGIGLKASHPNAKNKSKWKGLNLLGQALVKAREKIRANQV
jgi:ribA/ribD-fused uncharacterized protein